MKDAKGHGSDSKGGGAAQEARENRGGFNSKFSPPAAATRLYAGATAAVSHQSGVNTAVPQTPEAHIMAGGKLPTTYQHNDFVEGRTMAIKGWGDVSNTEYGKAAVARMQDAVDRAKANVARFGTEDNPSALTRSLRGQK